MIVIGAERTASRCISTVSDNDGAPRPISIRRSPARTVPDWGRSSVTRSMFVTNTGEIRLTACVAM